MKAGNLAELIDRIDMPEFRKFLRPAEVLEELKTLYYLATIKGLHQREIAYKMGISLGHANLLLRRLKMKSYIHVHKKNTQQVVYLLTSKGELYLNSETQQLEEAVESLKIHAQEQPSAEFQEEKPHESYHE